MMSEFMEDDAIPASQSQRPCEVCGETQFYAEAGFYFCSLCNTQSQSHRVYVDEDFIPERQLQTRAALLRDPKQVKKAKASEGKNVYYATSWEVWNVILKHIGDHLVEVGFPEIVKNKILHLYAAFMVRRKVIFVSQTNPTAKSKISLTESKTNVRSFYGVEVMPIPPRRRPKNKKIDDEEGDDEQGGNIHGKLTPEELATRAQRKKKFAMTRRKAIEQEYMLSEEAKQTQEDAEFEKAVSSKPGTSTSTESTSITEKDKSQKHVSFSYTKASRMIRNKYLKRFNVKKAISQMYSRRRTKKMKKNLSEFHKARNILSYEQFTFKSCIILVFVALRQLGFPIVFTDLLRLLRCGVFQLQHHTRLMKRYEQYKNISNLWHVCCRRPYEVNPRTISYDIEVFTQYLGIKKFWGPRMQEIVPKYIDDFVLPREFECVVNMFNHICSFEEIELAARAKKRGFERYRYIPEVLVMCQIVVILKILFGLDDLTEKYQSQFAKLVNKVIKEEVEAQGCQMEDWTELFDIEDWLGYIQRRRDLVKRELFSPSMCTPNIPPTLTKLNHLMKNKFTISGVNGDDDPEDLTLPQSNANECIYAFKSILKDRLPPPDETGQYPNIPNIKPYVPLPLPTQSIVDQYLERYPLVYDPSYKPELFKVDFLKKRIDFIWNPKKYTKLLEACGYNVKIVRGDAVNNFPKNLKEGTVLVFQPYKSFDEFIDGFRKHCSSSLKLLLGICEDIVHIVSAEKLRYKCTQDKQLFPLVTQVLGELYIERIILKRIPIFTRWDKEWSDE